MTSISFAITAKDEHKELEKLLTQITSYKQPQDEIVIQLDSGSSVEVNQVVSSFSGSISSSFSFPLNGDFSTFKNNLKNNCNGEYICFLDADEIPSKNLMDRIHEIIESNPTVELMNVSRVNIVEGITPEYIKQMGWKINSKGYINYPDCQTRIIQNIPTLQWYGNVHERITGAKTYAFIPSGIDLDLMHVKSFERQQQQNNYYNSL